ncbi:COG4315 family predicted lipoprotein [Sinomonas sp.]|jgi:predicted lipoprotein with Yx(FWY)xxD motif|uniref:COG4315 family predicted lipoprotein n=1 Tax=Sinomonas sp. TaxID=1914986 RepID=UPI002FE06A39
MQFKHRSLALAAASSAMLIALSGCGAGSAGSPQSTPPIASASGYAAGNLEPQASSRTTTSLRTATVDGQKIIVDSNGDPVYMYTLDNAGESKSVCLGSCALLWPAVESGDQTPQVQGITAKVGSMPAADGGKQITLNGMPIYYYAKDNGSGSATGQGVAGVWYVVAPDGSMIYGGQSSTTSSPSPTSSLSR